MNAIQSNSIKKLIRSVFCIFLIAILIFPSFQHVSAERLIDRYEHFLYEKPEKVELIDYVDALQSYKQEGLTAANAAVNLAVNDCEITGGDSKIVTEDGNSVLKLGDISSVTFSFDVQNAALYELQVTYRMQVGVYTRMRVKVDGVSPYKEAEDIKVYPSYYFDSNTEYDEKGNQLYTPVIRNDNWQTVSLRDSKQYISMPLCFALKAGKHTLTLETIENSLEIKSVALVKPTEIKDYNSVSANYKSSDDNLKTICIEAESAKDLLSINDSMIMPYVEKDALMTPSALDVNVFNAIGGTAWSATGQEIVCKFDVETPGLYKIALRYLQNFNDGTKSYRRIAIDGQVPFEEFLQYTFEYYSYWHCETLTNKDEKPLLVYLDKGPHTISFTSVINDNTSYIVNNIADIVEKLNTLYDKIVLVTGASPDPNYQYNLDETIPGLMDGLEDSVALLETLRKNLLEYNEDVSNEGQIKKIILQLSKLIEDPDIIPDNLGYFSDSTNTLSTISASLQTSALALDKIYFLSENQKVDREESSFLKRLWAMLKDFIKSFSNSYTSNDTSESEEELDIWISRPTKETEQIQSLIEKEFEPKYNIKVNLNVMPSGSLNGTSQNPLMLSVVSGTGPDLAMAMDAGTAVEYGIRGAAYDISKFSDYETVIKRFYPRIMNIYTFMGGVYAFPESMDFYVMVYRKDILEELKLEVPQTWDDVYNKVLPVLYQNNMEMEPPSRDTILLQNGAKFYSDDGLALELGSKAGFKGFEEYIDLFMKKGFPITFSFFNRFKSGEMPIGFLGSGEYLQLQIAAPEIAGKWDIAEMPGTLKEDGTIDRTHEKIGGAVDMILDNPDNAWTFLKWWSSTEVQSDFGQRIESVLGMGARHTPPNIEAYYNLNWNKEHLKIFEKSWAAGNPIPYVLGAQIVTRELNNAANKALYQNYTPRKALELAINNINDEFIRKQEMYNIKREVSK